MDSNTTIDPEIAVSQYLTLLTDPERLKDKEHAAYWAEQAEKATDVMEKLRMLANGIRAETIDVDRIRNDFVRHVRGWATENGIPAAAFQAVGVPVSVLAEAKMIDRGQKPLKKQVALRGTLDNEELIESLRHGPGTVKGLADRLGVSLFIVRGRILKLAAEGVVKENGLHKEEAARGRAAMSYTLA